MNLAGHRDRRLSKTYFEPCFNIVLFTVVDDVKTMKDKMLEEGATNAQTGLFYVQNKPQSDNQGNITRMFSSH